MKMSHPGFFNKNESEEKPVSVKTVMPPEDEKEFMREMASVVNENPVPREELKTLKKEDVEMNAKKKSAFEKLVFLQTPPEKDFVIGDLTFTLQLLNSDLNSRAYAAMSNLQNEEKVKINLCIAAACVTKLDGLPIEEAYQGEPTEDVYYKRYVVMEAWNSSLINSLIKRYNKFKDEVEGGYDKDFLEESQKTPTTE